jgi:hypothetical protein
MEQTSSWLAKYGAIIPEEALRTSAFISGTLGREPMIVIREGFEFLHWGGDRSPYLNDGAVVTLSWENGQITGRVDFEYSDPELDRMLYAVLGYFAYHEIPFE